MCSCPWLKFMVCDGPVANWKHVPVAALDPIHRGTEPGVDFSSCSGHWPVRLSRSRSALALRTGGTEVGCALEGEGRGERHVHGADVICAIATIPPQGPGQHFHIEVIAPDILTGLRATVPA